MEQIIWYSIPGAIVLFAVGLAIPRTTSGSNAGAVVAGMIAGTPIVGFIIHQLYFGPCLNSVMVGRDSGVVY